ncbi:MAG: hypothetical protein ACOC1V_06240, partial [Candidatus Saliniplasma sp.]
MDGICLTEVENEIQEGKKALTEEDLEEIAEIERGDTVSTEEESQEEESIQDGFVGVTFGDVGTTTLQCNVCNPVDKGEYIELHHPTADRVLGQIEKVERKTDLSVDKAIELSNGERIGIDETIIATINIIGYRDERGLLKLPGNPFRAGEKIYLAKEDLIRDVIGLKEDENGAFIGKLRGHDIEVKLDINSIAQKHLSVLAKT